MKTTSWKLAAGSSKPNLRHARAWIVLVGVLGLHVLDEALTHFLDFYNPLVLRIRSQISWFPMPTFTSGIWLTGLVAATLALAAMTPIIRRGSLAARLASYALSALMLLNGLGHLVGSIYFRRWLPGATSAPLLVIASVMLARATWTRGGITTPSQRGGL